MLLSFYGQKPLYNLERSIDYQRHKQKLKKIQNKELKIKNNTSMQIRPWIKKKMRIQLQKQNKIIQDQNQKLLTKLIKISNRNLSINHYQKYKVGQNLYRKHWLNNIKKQNLQISQKLTNLTCSLQYKKFSKSIDTYQRVKKSMMINRKIKLPLFNKSYLWKKFQKSNTQHNINDINTNDFNLSQQKSQKIPSIQKLKFSSTRDMHSSILKVNKKLNISVKSSQSNNKQLEQSP